MLDRSKLVDPLSDILSLLRPRNIACGAIDSGDACIAFPAGDGIKCHALTAGEAWLAVDGVSAPLRLRQGDCFILPHGRPYRLASDLSVPSIDYRIVLADRRPGHLKTWNGGGKATIVSAAFVADTRLAGMLLDVLPPIVHIREGPGQPSLRRPLQQMMEEFRDLQPGGRLIVEHLATIMLAETLRAYAMDSCDVQVGWLFALRDRTIGRAIGAMHDAPSYRWTIQGLADRVGMSRTSFAIRFHSKVGMTPMRYLTRLRMGLAIDRLTHSGDPIVVVAADLGYSSESAFSHAFKREIGLSPRSYVTGRITSGGAHQP